MPYYSCRWSVQLWFSLWVSFALASHCHWDIYYVSLQSSIVHTLLGKRKMTALLWYVAWVLSVTVCFLFLLVSWVGYDKWLWLSLDIFYISFVIIYVLYSVFSTDGSKAVHLLQFSIRAFHMWYWIAIVWANSFFVWWLKKIVFRDCGFSKVTYICTGIYHWLGRGLFADWTHICNYELRQNFRQGLDWANQST